ncbi:hypothetical protein [Dyella mobilis]|uniref:Lipoprotein n=1 Tax=Dyella mobilis TaxID=1849582 RepID=A0ABS2KEY8_9GAMM|nr:hypothetical protein [Dyella mobilis]MBM7128918.1 hypothetical protein [Dyella mobilis]GLQ99392.1 hypothetical protein GCM10007863_38120 [Dyella mobilis]
MKTRELVAFVVLGTSMILAGCAVDTRPSPQQTAADQTTCQGYGYQPGTNRFADCMMSLANRRSDSLEKQQRDAAQWRQQQQQQDNAWASQQNNQNQNTQNNSNCTTTSTTQQSGNQQNGDTTTSQTVTNTVTKCH